MDNAVEIKKEALLEIFYLLEKLHENRFFRVFSRITEIASNYRVFLTAAKRPEAKQPLVIDIEGIEKTTIGAPASDENQSKFETLVELTFRKPLFSGGRFEKLKKDYGKYKKERKKAERIELYDSFGFREEYDGLSDVEKTEIGDYEDFVLRKIAETFAERYNEEEIKELITTPEDEKPSPGQLEEKLEFSTNDFYMMNELITECYTGGVWRGVIPSGLDNLEDYCAYPETYFTDTPCALSKDWRQLYDVCQKNGIILFLEASLFHEGGVSHEKLLEFAYEGFNNCINPRQLKNGIYCPLGSREFVESLSYSAPVKSYLERIVSYIDTIPSVKLKKETIKEIHIKLLESPLFKDISERKETADEIIKYLKKYYNIYETEISETEQLHKKLEALADIVNKQREWKKQIPPYFNKLSNPRQKELKQILKTGINHIIVPFSEEEPEKYRLIIQNLGALVENTAKEHWQKNVTIGRWIRSSEAGEYLERYDEEEKKAIEEYSKKYTDIYNKAKHEANYQPSFEEFMQFVKASNRILEIILDR